MLNDPEPSKTRGRKQPERDTTETGWKSLERLGRQGWIGVAAWMTFGVLLEGLLGYKIPVYLSDPQRRELFRLAHAHGAALGLLLVLAAIWMQKWAEPPGRTVVLALRIGTLLVPAGFLLSGIWHFESDPGYGIWLVPAGAMLVIFGTVAVARGNGRRRQVTGGGWFSKRGKRPD